MIEIITSQDVRNLYIDTEHGKFTPLYEYDDYNADTDTYTNFRVIKTAEEVYQEWLETKDLPPQPTEMEVLTARVDDLETVNAGLLLENAEQQIKIKQHEEVNKEQEITNANLLLEIATLKGSVI